MVHTDEMIDEELAKKLNDGVKHINDVFGEDTIVMDNDNRGEGWINIIVSGRTEYSLAETCEAEAYIEGMEKVLALQKERSSADKRKVFVLYNTYYRSSTNGNGEPIIVGVFEDYAGAHKAFEEQKKEITSMDYDEGDFMVETDDGFDWLIQQNDWEDWDHLHIEQTESSI